MVNEPDDSRGRVEKLLDSKHPPGRSTTAVLGELSDQERARLLDLAAGRVENATRGDRAKAMHLLARLGTDDGAATLGRVAADDSEDRDLRLSAIVALGSMSPDLSEAHLVSRLADEDESIRGGALRAVGQVGRGRTLEALRGGEGRFGDAQRREYDFVRAIVAQRIGAQGESIVIPPPSRRHPEDFEQRLDVELLSQDRTSLGEALAEIDGSTYGLRLSEERGFRARIGKAEWAVLLDAEADARGLPAVMRQRSVIAVLARRMPETGLLSVQYLVWVEPSEQRVEMAVVRTSGEVLYSGWLDADGDTLRFLVGDVERAGTAPTLVSGRVGPEGIEVESYASPRRLGKRRTEPLEI